MKKRTIKLWGVLALVLAGLSVYLFAQSSSEKSSSTANQLHREVKDLGYKYCDNGLDGDPDEYFDCIDCIYVWVAQDSNANYDEQAREQRIQKRLERMKEKGVNFEQKLLDLKADLLKPREKETNEQRMKREIILTNLERRQWRRAIGRRGEYNFPALKDFMLNGELTADGCVRVLKELYDEVSHDLKSFEEKDIFYGKTRLELFQEMTLDIQKRVKEIKMGEDNFGRNFVVVTQHGRDIVNNLESYSINSQCLRILELGKY